MSSHLPAEPPTAEHLRDSHGGQAALRLLRLLWLRRSWIAACVLAAVALAVSSTVLSVRTGLAGTRLALLIAVYLLAVAVIVRHVPYIRRLVEGRENKFSLSRKPRIENPPPDQPPSCQQKKN